jgi:sec-independent protein translocase protein TatC
MAERRKFGRGSLTPSADAPDYDEEQSRMSIWSHLTELRNRLVKAMIALVLGTVIGFIAAGDGLDILRQPYCEIVQQTEECRLVTLGPTGNVIVYFRVSLLIGAIVSIPIVTYQLLMFIFPGLTRKERRMILASIPAVTFLFLVGVGFSWYVLMRPALGFLEGFQTDIFRPEWTADLYLSFVTSLLFWMGVAFQTPLILFVLSLIGIVDAPGLRRAWRVAVVGAAAASAFITPTVDPVNMMLVMAPLIGLYIISIFLVMIGQRIAGLQAAAAEANPG